MKYFRLNSKRSAAAEANANYQDHYNLPLVALYIHFCNKSFVTAMIESPVSHLGSIAWFHSRAVTYISLAIALRYRCHVFRLHSRRPVLCRL